MPEVAREGGGGFIKKKYSHFVTESISQSCVFEDHGNKE